MLPGTWDDDVVLARSLHAHVHVCWIPAHPCLCPLDPHMHTLTGYTCMHACLHRVPTSTCSQGPAHSHWVPMPARSWDPYASMHEAIHTHLHRAMYARSHQAPTPAWSPCMHAPGPCAHACTGPPHPLGLHAHTHRAYALMCSVPAIRVRETKS